MGAIRVNYIDKQGIGGIETNRWIRILKIGTSRIQSYGRQHTTVL